MKRPYTQSGENKFCVYCGDWYECRDHVTPVLWRRVYRDYKQGETVYCCHMCNNLANDYVAFSIADKALYLVYRYQHKYDDVLALPKWSSSEINELSGTLKQYVKGKQLLRELLLRKLENLDQVSMGFPAVEIVKIIVN